MRRRLLSVLLLVPTMTLAGLIGAATPSPASPSPAAPPGPTGTTGRPPLPSVYPTPQHITAKGGSIELGRSVALVTGASSDPAAVAAVRSVLMSAQVKHVDEVTAPAAPPGGETAIYVGGAQENSSTEPVLAGLGVDGADGLAAEGYVLASGRVRGSSVVVLDGKDTTGTFYAAQTLRQLVTTGPGPATVPGVEVRDWPTYPLRGVIEGFYGTPWSNAARDDQLVYYGAHKMNTYVYSPKDDAYLRAQWRDAYPPAQLAEIKGLVDTAVANHVKFTYALSPGLSVCYSSAADEKALSDKFQSLWDIGVRDFAVPLDDISYTKWNCPADQAKFGTGGAAAGAAQAFLLNAVQANFIATHPGASRLQMVPTEYYDVAASGYKDTIKAQLDPAVIVEWTGVGVIAPVFTKAQAAAAKAVFGHDLLVWDNYPVNDYVTSRLLLGPYVGRDAGLSESLYGITANPMIQPEASKVSLFNVADYTWNDEAYDAQASWQASLTELAGGDAQARAALAAFADLEHYSDIDKVQAPVLAAQTAAFWPAWETGDTRAATRLDTYLRTIATAEATLTNRMGDPAFVEDAKPWLGATTAWGQAARTALQMLQDQRRGHGQAAMADRALVTSLVTKAKSFTYVGLGGSSTKVAVGDGVIDTFVNAALAENDRWLGLAGQYRTATTSLPTYQSNTPDKMIDGDDATYFWSSAAPTPGDSVGVDLGSVQPITSIALHMGKTGSVDDYIHAGALEYSADGTTWTPVSATTTADVTATLPASTQARFVRLRATAAQTSWVVVRELTVTGSAVNQPVASGTPVAAPGSSLGAVVDGRVDTAYTAAAAPRTGDALVVTLPTARPLDRVEVVGTGAATVEVRTAGQWRPIGSLAAGYTELGAGGRTVDTIRLTWVAGSAVPTVAEVVPRYADVPVVDLTATPAAVETEVGATSTVTVGLTSPRAATTSGRLTVTAPTGLSVKPRTDSVTLQRGAQVSLPVTVSGTTPGTYPVALTFTAGHAAPVTETVTVTVHPLVSATNMALASQGATATAASVEQDLAKFTPDHAIDGDLTTRWSSGYTDTDWFQVELAQPQHLGKVVLRWEPAHASAYRLQVSTDGTTWTTAVDVTQSNGGVETLWLDRADVKFVRMQGVSRATAYGYSLFELEAYPFA